MPHTAIPMPENPRRDFRTHRPSRRERLRAFAARAAVVALAIAVPAVAASGSLAALESGDEAEAALMPFETPGESFPGSAFYYLEETPQLVEGASGEAPVAVIGEPARGDTALGELPLAASPLRISGSDRDHMRAQECMAQAIYYEAASESDAGQRAVAQVVLNRVAHPAWPRTVCGVVYQGSERSTGCQFTFTCDGALARRPSASGWARASRTAREALAGVVYAPVGTATHYHTLAVNPYWASSLDSVGVIGAHIFYRWRGNAGRPAAFTARYAGGEPSASRASANTPPAPLPESVAHLGEPSAAPALAAPTVAPRASQPAETAAEDRLPQSGDVRSEYANSGRWIARPGS